MKMANFYKLILFVAICAVNVLSASAQNDPLQELIDNLATATTRASGTPTDIDLSAYSEPRTTTLYVRNGVNVRFVNGTLTRATTLKAPLVEVTGGSRLELGDESAISGNNVVTGYELVKLNNGVLVVNGGKIGGNTEYSPYTGDGSGGIVVQPVGYRPVITDIPVLMTNVADQLEERSIPSISWQITCSSAKAKISIYQYASQLYYLPTGVRFVPQDHIYDIETNGNLYIICPDAKGWGNYGTPTRKINLTGTNSITVSGKYALATLFEVTAKNKKVGDVIAVAADGHKFTQEEVEKFSLVDMDDCELVLKNNQIVIQKKVTAVTDGQTLQQRLDEIAASGTSSLSKPETIEIPASGITINTYLQVRNKCHAKLTGGPIRISPSIGAHYPIQIWNSCSLVFENITIDFMNNGFKTHSGIFDIFGDLTINKGVQFVNVPQSKGDYGECLFGLYGGTFTYWDGTIKAKRVSIVGERFNKGGTVNLYGGVLETTAVAVVGGSCEVNVYGCKVKGSSDWATIIADKFDICENAVVETTWDFATTVEARTATYRGKFTLKGQNIIVRQSAEITGSQAMPEINLWKDAVITATSKLQYKWTISSSNWKEFTLGKAFVKSSDGYKLTAADFNQMTFQGLPNDLEAYYDAKDYSVKLRKKTVVEEKVDNSDDLQNFIDGLGDNKGTEDDPIKVPVGDDGLVIDKDVDIEDDLQLLIDGTGRDDLQILIDGGYINQKVGLGYFGFKNLWMGSSAGTRASASGGGINNRGKMVFSNCTLENGNYSINNFYGGMLILKDETVTGSGSLIVNSGDVFIDGSVSVGNLENTFGGRIYIMDQLTKDIHINYASEDEIELNTPIVMGDGYFDYYSLTAEDLEHISISLPEGFAWEYSKEHDGIVIVSTSGITGVNSDSTKRMDIYDMVGRKQKTTGRGVLIQRMSNGEVRKMVVK